MNLFKTLTICLVMFAHASANDRNPKDWPTVVRVRVPSGRGAFSVGSGTCVFSTTSPSPVSYVLTAAHVIRGGTGAPTCEFSDGKRYACTVIYNNPSQDVTVLRFDAARPHYTPLSPRLPGVGENVIFVGYGGQRPYFLAYVGRVTGGLGSGAGARDTIEAQTQGRISQGDSGGAILYRGNLVGVISAKDSRGHGIGPVVCYQTLQRVRSVVLSDAGAQKCL